MLADTWAESKTLCRRRFILVGGERKRRFISDTFQVLILFLFIKKKIKKIKKIIFFFYTALFISPEGIPKLPLVTGA